MAQRIAGARMSIEKEQSHNFYYSTVRTLVVLWIMGLNKKITNSPYKFLIVKERG